jgi:membrane protein implicated in regulation of membrane protease activity
MLIEGKGGKSMERIFYLTFATGILYAVVSFILSNAFGDLDSDINIDWSDIGFLDIPISPFRPVVIACFVTVFGGIGLLVRRYYGLPSVLSFLIAFAAALTVSFLLYRLVVVPLYRAQNGFVHDMNEIAGRPALVTHSIYGGQYGRVRYTINGEIFSAPARSVDGLDIRQGEESIIVKVEKNLLLVQKASVPGKTAEQG